MALKCNTCRVDVSAKSNFVQFSCPDCGQENIVRCSNCKVQSNKYICNKCNFTGP